ncbi:glycogen synthase isoform 1 [Puccinia graminis f. sp. tritici]|uniref:Glycogen [starch] synthase n=1 Tax=Puccinia graminis f. sp. tritici TaxID=56615 RepID=A0A5B0PSC2_PUCGR|nr:glycogen synthase isoform 1 [Puccinia graminis f. sp. tritici]
MVTIPTEPGASLAAMNYLNTTLDEWKTPLWNLAGIPAPPNDSETNNSIVFGYLVAWF